ncbi:MAG TPA: CoA transferase [Candidatus Acidoferrum sp.]|nr:CoA transferase [Candidatus Acidoferrum sp.]
MTKALDGIRVLDLSQFEAGPSCAETLAWMGADVIKIEPPGGEQSRRGLSERPDIDAVFFCLLNCNKRAITLNLKTDRGKQMFTELVKTADVVLENLGPGSMERLGFGYDDLAKINPRIISASVKGFGSTGPYASYNSFEMIAQAMGGVMALTGEKDGPPLRVEAGLGDTGSGLHTAIGILGAIIQRQVTGVGQRIEVAQMDVVINMTRIHFRDYYLGVDPIPRKGNRSPQACPSNTYRCKPFGPNDYVFVHTANIEMWKALTKVLGRPELGDDPRYQTREGRMAAQAELEAMVEGFTSTRTKHEVMELMGKAGVPCGAVLDSTEIMNNEHLRQRGMVVDIEHPTRGKMAMLGSPIRMSASPVEVTPAPLLGEHNTEVYGKLLGLNDEDLAALKREKVI